MRGKPVVCLMGPTASGKTAVAMQLAGEYSMELVSVDSALVYRGMDIGTAKPGPDELRRHPHHLIDIREPEESYSAGDVVRDANDLIETIHLAGYITAEKVAIARHHLWPRQLSRGGVKRSQLRITDAALRQLVEGYAREAGVRNLEKQLGRIVRKAAVKLLKGEKAPISIGTKQLEASTPF